MNVNELAKRYPTASEYISQIYLILRDYTYCNNRRLADHIGVSPSAVSQAVGRLKRLDIAEQDKYGMIMLRETGVILAEQILRRHYLLEHLMVRKLHFPWDLADKEAEHLQDKVSDDFTDHLEQELGHPRVCPHGNPFPCNPDAPEILSAPRLIDCTEGEHIEIVRITEEGERVEGLLHLCYLEGVVPGTTYRITRMLTEELELAEDTTGRLIVLPRSYGEHLRVKSVAPALTA
ncbi:MAG: metal-dependent transcriptional regulator [Spirochaetia bacterium]|nr:metal-dependent transcriptional regulator [Spirochaetia bacterium]MCF7940351.1 metal-dependent transcriptional regulator [Spirochaetia bacterium]